MFSFIQLLGSEHVRQRTIKDSVGVRGIGILRSQSMLIRRAYLNSWQAINEIMLKVLTGDATSACVRHVLVLLQEMHG